MKYIVNILLFSALSFYTAFSQNANLAKAYGPLFDSVQLNEVFNDQKTFTDCRPLRPLQDIKADYLTLSKNPGFSLAAFVAQNFDTTFTDTTDLLNHIDYLWDYLTRIPVTQTTSESTLIQLPNRYIVPGGRFREIYYWDSYFTMLGLQVAGKDSLIKNMLDNFSWLITTYGHIPNGNRSYYLSRSQPPFFSLMVELYANMQTIEALKQKVYSLYRPAVLMEYSFWMDDANQLTKPGTSNKRVVRLDNEYVLNRYWDALCVPRPESFKQDVTAKISATRDTTMYRDIRAAAESGWDFSSRWFTEDGDLSTIQTTQLIPVDLNCLLYYLESFLAKTATVPSDKDHFSALAQKRKEAVEKYLWNEALGCFTDYNLNTQSPSTQKTLATLYPLFVDIASKQQAVAVAELIEAEFLQPGGLVTTLNNTGEQWDAPNGWAPLQWIGYQALKQYTHDALATDIAQRWLNLNVKVFFETNKMMEKYDVVDINRQGGGGEYPLQDGFGWSNGVFLALWNALH